MRWGRERRGRGCWSAVRVLPSPSAFSSRGCTFFSAEEREARTGVGGTEGDVEGVTRGKGPKRWCVKPKRQRKGLSGETEEARSRQSLSWGPREVWTSSEQGSGVD